MQMTRRTSIKCWGKRPMKTWISLSLNRDCWLSSHVSWAGLIFFFFTFLTASLSVLLLSGQILLMIKSIYKSDLTGSEWEISLQSIIKCHFEFFNVWVTLITSREKFFFCPPFVCLCYLFIYPILTSGGFSENTIGDSWFVTFHICGNTLITFLACTVWY